MLIKVVRKWFVEILGASIPTENSRASLQTSVSCSKISILNNCRNSSTANRNLWIDLQITLLRTLQCCHAFATLSIPQLSLHLYNCHKKTLYSIQNWNTHLSQPNSRPAHIWVRLLAKDTTTKREKRYFRASIHFTHDNPYRKLHYSVENRNLHPAQPSREPAQIQERMSVGNTVKIRLWTQYLGQNPLFEPDNRGRKRHHSTQNRILHPAQPCREPAQI